MSNHIGFVFETCRFADVSTSHMTAADNARLSRDPSEALPNLCGRLAHGYLFSTHGCESGAPEKLAAVYSADLCNILVAAAQQGISYVHFDADGGDVAGAPRFDW